MLSTLSVCYPILPFSSSFFYKKCVDIHQISRYSKKVSLNCIPQAGMAELADAPDLGSGVHDVQVQVLLPAVETNTLLVSFY